MKDKKYLSVTFSRPPRPSPGSVNYSDEETKFPDEDSSTLSEKPSDLSDDNSQVT